MWLHKGLDVTSVIEIQHPSPPRRQGQVGVHPPETGSGGCGSDGTDSTMEGLSIPEDREPEARNPGGQRSVDTMGETGGRQQAGATWRSWHIAGSKEALA